MRDARSTSAERRRLRTRARSEGRRRASGRPSRSRGSRSFQPGFGPIPCSANAASRAPGRSCGGDPPDGSVGCHVDVVECPIERADLLAREAAPVDLRQVPEVVPDPVWCTEREDQQIGPLAAQDPLGDAGDLVQRREGEAMQPAQLAGLLRPIVLRGHDRQAKPGGQLAKQRCRPDDQRMAVVGLPATEEDAIEGRPGVDDMGHVDEREPQAGVRQRLPERLQAQPAGIGALQAAVLGPPDLAEVPTMVADRARVDERAPDALMQAGHVGLEPGQAAEAGEPREIGQIALPQPPTELDEVERVQADPDRRAARLHSAPPIERESTTMLPHSTAPSRYGTYCRGDLEKTCLGLCPGGQIARRWRANAAIRNRSALSRMKPCASF